MGNVSFVINRKFLPLREVARESLNIRGWRSHRNFTDFFPDFFKLRIQNRCPLIYERHKRTISLHDLLQKRIHLFAQLVFFNSEFIQFGVRPCLCRRRKSFKGLQPFPHRVQNETFKLWRTQSTEPVTSSGVQMIAAHEVAHTVLFGISDT